MPSGSGNLTASNFVVVGIGQSPAIATVSLVAANFNVVGIGLKPIIISPVLAVADGIKYTEFFLNSASSLIEYELLEITHPNFSIVYRVVKNNVNGISVTLETGAVEFFDYYPLSLEGSNVRADLDFILKIKLGDLGEILPMEVDRVMAAPLGLASKPQVVLRTYRSDDLTKPMYGPLFLDVTDFNHVHDGAEFEAKAPTVNINRVGEFYSLDRFDMLKDVL